MKAIFNDCVTEHYVSGVLYVIQEFCCHGNLRSYLHRHRATFVNTMDDIDVHRQRERERLASENVKTVDYVNTRSDGSLNLDEDNSLTTKDLLCYAFQIARGTEYLSSKKV